MSELIVVGNNQATFRRKLLTGASALALTAYVFSTGHVLAEDTDQPQVWVELGGQLSRLSDKQELFAPSLMDVRPSYFSPSQKFEKPPLFSVDGLGKISIQPEGSNWVFDASIQYGRSTSNKHVIQQTHNSYPFTEYGTPVTVIHYAVKFADTLSRNTEQHAILDFRAGRDVGLGMFGEDRGSSVVSVGVRFAQFSSRTNVTLKSNPDWAIEPKYVSGFKIPMQNYHTNIAELTAARSFHGVGPSLSWSASAPVAGHSRDGELTLDWGINAAILFGRQKTRTHHQTTGRYHYWKYSGHSSAARPITYKGPATPDHVRSRSVTVPNVGGFAGISLRYPNAKVSFGYKADFFFGAMDGGIDVRRTEDVGFSGPFATVSIGLGG